MQIRVFSDLHLEFEDWTPPAAAADVIVLAGDIHVGSGGIAWARRHFPAQPVVYVPGNHEFYGSEMHAQLEALRQVARAHEVHLLDAEGALIEGTRFLGATLWTDFEFDGADPASVAGAMGRARRLMPDYQIVRHRGPQPLAPEDTRAIHRAQRAWLAARLSEPCAGATVVVTHHLPHRLSVHGKYQGNSLNPAFATHLPELVRRPVDLWIHGHTHESLDYVVEGTRVVCNPRGYLPQEPNPDFDPLGVMPVG